MTDKKSKRIILHFALSFCILIFAFYIFTATVFAASFFFDAPVREWRVGEQITVSVFLNTERADINAVSGKISYPAGILSLREIRDGNSIVNFWIERPSVNTRNATNIKTNRNENISGYSCGEANDSCRLVLFSGITPGGYQGERGLLFSLLFVARQEGQGMIEITETKTLLNDGQGTETESRGKNLLVSIGAEVDALAEALPEDIDPPSAFVPKVARDHTIFDGKWFLVFATQDKGVGMSHFEIKESRHKFLNMFTRWQTAESPYLLRDQALRSYIYVKAVDRAGNERIEILEPRYPLRWYENWALWVIIIVVIVFLLLRSRIAQIISRFWRPKTSN